MLVIKITVCLCRLLKRTTFQANPVGSLIFCCIWHRQRYCTTKQVCHHGVEDDDVDDDDVDGDGVADDDVGDDDVGNDDCDGGDDLV